MWAFVAKLLVSKEHLNAIIIIILLKPKLQKHTMNDEDLLIWITQPIGTSNYSDTSINKLY